MIERAGKPLAWLRFGIDGPDAIFLSDRARWSAAHREHSWKNRGVIVGSDDWSERYLVAAFPWSTTELVPCEVCGEPNALIVGDGVGNILYIGGDLIEAERVFDEAFH
jgi:hypothetical protein